MVGDHMDGYAMPTYRRGFEDADGSAQSDDPCANDDNWPGL